jgi:Zn-dependent peptidase ImmA (M78 family)/transcriptional regulator with XRE-family HTH domain
MQPIGGMLRLARQRKGFHQKDAAPLLGIEQPLLSRIENDLALPAEEILQRAERIYELPRSFFFLTDTIYGPPVSVHAMWRKKSDVSARELDSIVAELNIRAMHLRRLMEGVELKAKADIPRLDIDDYDDIERIAGVVRAHWKVPSGPVKNITVLAERAGIVVMFSRLANTSVSGVTFSIPGMLPIILLNEDQPADRLRFTLVHEIGHLVMHRFPSANMEDEANAFASAFLMPANDIRSAFLRRNIDLPLLGALKPEWKVAMQALLMRASALGFVPPGRQQYLWKQINARGIRLREPPQYDFPREYPTIMPRIFEVHKKSLGYSDNDLARMLCINAPEMIAMYGAPSPPANDNPRSKLTILM